MDFAILHAIQEGMGHEVLDMIMPYITFLANGGIFWLLLGTIFIFFKQYRFYGIQTIGAVALAGGIVNFVIKPLVNRPRPFEIDQAYSLLITAPSSSSFPSGHSAASIAAAVVICSMPIKLYWKILAVILACAIAFSRLYLYVHFPSDVLVGSLIGLGCGLLVVFLAKRSQKNLPEQKQ